MGTTAIPDTLPIGAVIFIIIYLGFCLASGIWHERQKEDIHDDKTPRV